MAGPGIVIAHLKSIFEMESLGADTLQNDLKKVTQGMSTDQVTKFITKVNELSGEYQQLKRTADTSAGSFTKQSESEASTTAASIKNVVSQAAQLSSALRRAEGVRGFGLGLFGTAGMAGLAGTVIGGPAGGALAAGAAAVGVPAAIAAVVNKGIIEGLRPAIDKLLSSVVPRGSAQNALTSARQINAQAGTGILSTANNAKLAMDVMAKLPSIGEMEAYINSVREVGRAYSSTRFVVAGFQNDLRQMIATTNTLAGIVVGMTNKLKESASSIAAMSAVAGGSRTGKEAMAVRNAAQVQAEQMAATATKERLAEEIAAKAKLANAEASLLAAKAHAVQVEAANVLAAAEGKVAQTVAAQTAAVKQAAAAQTNASAASQGFASSLGNVASKVSDLWGRLSSLKQKVQEASSGGGGASWNGMLASIGKLGAASAVSTGPIASLLGRAWALSYAIESVGAKAVAAVSGISGLVGGVLAFKNAAVDVMVRLEGVKIGLERITSDGGASWKLLGDLAMKYGVAIGDVAKPYQKLLVASQSSDVVGGRFKEMIDNITASVSALGVSKDDVGGVFRALEQMFSKGVVRAEEFSQQLGDHLPAAAKVGLITFREMTGNAEASMLDFFNAMHKGTIAANEFIPSFIKNYRSMVAGTADGGDTINGVINRMGTAWDRLIMATNAAVGVTNVVKSVYGSLASTFDYVGKNLDVVAGAVSGLATAITVRLAGPATLGALSALSSGISSAFIAITSGNLVASVTSLTASLLPLLTRLGLIAAAAMAVGAAVYYMTGSAKADPLSGVTESVERAEKALAQYAMKKDMAANVTLDRSRNELSYKISELEQYRLTLEKTLDAKRKVNSGRAYQGGGAGEIAKLSGEMKTIDEQILRLRVLFDEMNEVTSKTFAVPTDNAREMIKAQDELSKKLQESRDYLDDIGAVGVKAAQSQREINREMGRFSALTSDSGARAKYLADLRELQRLKENIAAKEKEEKPRKALQSDTDRYKNIIQRAQDFIDGVGSTDANRMSKMRKDLDEYAEALRRVGTTESEIAPKVDQLRYAFEMQASGINLTTLQFKPFMALQKGLEGMADTFADLATSGKLSFDNLQDAVKKSTLSIMRDMMAMIIKVGMVKPVLQGLFGATNSAGEVTQAGLFSGLFGMADGGVVNQPTYFSVGNGNLAKTGEMGPEAVLPLSRGSDGRLGVAVNGGSGVGGSGGNTYQVTYNINAQGAQMGVGDQIAGALREYDKSLPGRLADINKRT